MRLIISGLVAAALLIGFATSGSISAQESRKYRNYDRYDDYPYDRRERTGTTPSVASFPAIRRATPTISASARMRGGRPWIGKAAAVTRGSRRPSTSGPMWPVGAWPAGFFVVAGCSRKLHGNACGA